MQNQWFMNALPIIETIEKHGYQAFFVGGCVRDLLSGRPIGDIDITTSAKPEVIQELFDKVIPVGIEHGTVIVRYNQVSYEVTTFRSEGEYSDNRHPDEVTFIDELDKDLERRDFTINALAMNKDGEIIDLFGGQEDIQQKIIRTVGNASERFKEDALRMIRALRFSSQLGFRIHSNTLKQMTTLRSDIQHLAVERIEKECAKLFAGDYVSYGVNYLEQTEIYRYLPVFSKYPILIEKVNPDLNPLLSFGECIAYFHLLLPDVTVKEWIKSWKCSNQLLREANEIVTAYHQYNNIGLDNWLVYNLETDFYEGFVRVSNLMGNNRKVSLDNLFKLQNELPIQSRKMLAINGNDLVALFPDAKKGPWLQKLLRDIEKAVVYREVPNSKQEIKEWIRCNPPVIN
ncbi:CCA tRNA nucleotidyltransferase [Oceanobacillus piezotolerans]|uniref:CCA-adding enzyme n=1 Tax=Oceanobacillus piezotolerans TaxID=2448030 RepID=A0A498DDT4_9BACI|nr:CCA tRNA nucleotidyltransferase [Oceanobacillus piezotolerans]RLL48226.1 CCA tRNA nucleotidyltransferase [Oceanobacillus piezotolerans]